MTGKNRKTDFDDVESRRGFVGKRKMSIGRRVYYFFGLPVLLAVLQMIWWTYRIEKVIGKDVVERVLAEDKVYAPCYWHQHTVLCLHMMRDWMRRGFRAGFVVSPSVDGEVPARIARSWGAEVIRGSAKRTGALAMRDIHAVMNEGVSIVTAADGPLGPKYEFKLGVVLMALVGSATMIPIACAADRAWYLRRWDNFMIPKPFARIVLAVGEPQVVTAAGSRNELEEHRKAMQDAIISLQKRSEEALQVNNG
ncbi:MAG: DUF374 domain-containing protein [Gammaproteobacteria bacterium]|nr:DUF374 domain-containing protein [Gammaproteobacteria bacterium]